MSRAVAFPEMVAEARGPRNVGGARLGQLGAGLGVLAVAAAARLYELRDVPRLTDETDEVMRGWAIARGELLPLTNVDAYIGPLWNYLLALGFLLAGPSSLLPRLLTAAAALLTVVATAWLGRELAHRVGRPAWADLIGLGGALLLATSSFHAVVSARIAWSHALTPLAMTVALACLLRWERLGEGRALGAAGLACGLVVHTHPTALALAPGLGLWALLHGQAALRSRVGWAALGLFVLANLPMLVFNLLSGLGSVAAAAQVQRAYAGAAPATAGGYLANLGALLSSLPLLLAGEIGERRGQVLALDDPLPFLYAGVAAVGLVLAARRRCLLPLLLVGSAALVLPAANGKYEPLFNGRYLAPLLPLGFGLLVLGLAWLVSQVAPGPGRWRVVTGVLVVLLTVPPLLALAGYVRATLEFGPNNRELYRAAEIVAAAGSPKPVLVDATLSGARLSTGREGTGVLEYLLILDAGVPVRRLQPDELARAVEGGLGDLVVVSPRLLARLGKDFVAESPPGEEEARRGRRAGFVVARIVGPA